MKVGSAGSGIFSIARFSAKKAVVVGGDYEKPNLSAGNLAFTSDGGKSWKAGRGLTGYRSSVAYVTEQIIIAVGTNGSDISSDGGKTWRTLGNEDLNSVASLHYTRIVWAVGPKGLVVKLSGLPSPIPQDFPKSSKKIKSTG